MEDFFKDELCELVVIENQRGLHARAAAKFVKAAENFQADISVVYNDMRVSGRSIMGLMMLAATRGSRLKLYACGNDAESAIMVLSELVKRKFDENE